VSCSIARIIDRFGDDPELCAERSAVSGKKAGAVQKSLIVRLTVLLAHLAPIASGVPLEKLFGRLTGLLESFEGSRRGDDLAEREFWLGFGDHRRPFISL
jgi:hypothetical protein